MFINIRDSNSPCWIRVSSIESVVSVRGVTRVYIGTSSDNYHYDTQESVQEIMDRLAAFNYGNGEY